MGRDKDALRQRLQEYRVKLETIQIRYGCSENIGEGLIEWMNDFRPFVKQNCRHRVDMFREIAEDQNWFFANRETVEDGQAKFAHFIDDLLAEIPETDVHADKSTPATEVTHLPFFPFQRSTFKSSGIAEYGREVQLAALQSGTYRAELQALGGYGAVLESIRRHVPDFDPTEAQLANGASWMKLKPVLVRCGLAVDENTTLTDIKAFLDATTVASPQTPADEAAMPDAKNVFVIHGRNEAARVAMFDFLFALGLNPIEWDEAVKMTGKGSPYVGEIVDAAFREARAVVALLTGDDVACLREELQRASDPDYEKNLTPQARPNVLFEAGMAFGRHPDQTILVQMGTLRPFSDIGGRHIIHFADNAQKRTELKERLKTAKCDVKESGTHWLTAGNFAEALKVAAAGPAKSKKTKKS